MDYIEAFKNLRTNTKFSRKSPHKAVLLLTVIEMYETNVLSDNEIKFDETLKSVFLKVWNRVLPDEKKFFPSAYLPFWYMQSEEFWHVVPVPGKEDILHYLRDTKVKPSEAMLEDSVRYAELDEDLFFLITMQSGRASLKRALLETYFSLSVRMIEKLSASSDNSIDHSISAMEEYKMILEASNNDTFTPATPKSNEELQNEFIQLSEDIQLVFNIEYYSFLKKHRQEREMFKEICPTVYDLYDKIVNHPIKQGEIYPSLAFTYENFLSDLKISFMGEDYSMDLVDKINDAINVLNESMTSSITLDDEEPADTTSMLTVDKPEPVDMLYVEKGQPLLPPAKESRKGKAWTKEEEALVSSYFQQGYGTDEIAAAIGRTEVAIKLRLSALGLMTYTYGDDDSASTLSVSEPLPGKSERVDFSVENSPSYCSIYNSHGECVYTTDGKFKIFHGKVYRFNYKSMCFTVKDMVGNCDNWFKGTKKLVAYDKSELYRVLNPSGFIDQIEDFLEKPEMKENTIKVNGVWYDFYGKRIENDETDSSQLDSSDENNGLLWTEAQKEEAIKYYKSGHSIRTIAFALKRSEASVKAMINRILKREKQSVDQLDADYKENRLRVKEHKSSSQQVEGIWEAFKNKDLQKKYADRLIKAGNGKSTITSQLAVLKSIVEVADTDATFGAQLNESKTFDACKRVLVTLINSWGGASQWFSKRKQFFLGYLDFLEERYNEYGNFDGEEKTIKNGNREGLSSDNDAIEKELKEKSTTSHGWKVELTYRNGEKKIMMPSDALETVVNTVGPEAVYRMGLISGDSDLVCLGRPALSQFYVPINNGYWLKLYGTVKERFEHIRIILSQYSFPITHARLV